MAKRLSKKEKQEMLDLFTIGKSIDDLSKDFNCTKLTISRNLKKTIGEKKYKELFIKSKSSTNSNIKTEKNIINEIQSQVFEEDHTEKLEEFIPIIEFTEIAPLDYEIDDSKQKDFSSVQISEVNFPKLVYMIVDNKIELQIKYLKDYPDWQFLSKDELNRKTIEIYFDLKIAKRSCNKDQKVIKVPNTNVFKIVAPLLLSRGISRIVSSDQLIAL